MGGCSERRRSGEERERFSSRQLRQRGGLGLWEGTPAESRACTLHRAPRAGPGLCQSPPGREEGGRGGAGRLRGAPEQGANSASSAASPGRATQPAEHGTSRGGQRGAGAAVASPRAACCMEWHPLLLLFLLLLLHPQSSEPQRRYRPGKRSPAPSLSPYPRLSLCFRFFFFFRRQVSPELALPARGLPACPAVADPSSPSRPGLAVPPWQAKAAAGVLAWGTGLSEPGGEADNAAIKIGVVGGEG